MPPVSAGYMYRDCDSDSSLVEFDDPVDESHLPPQADDQDMEHINPESLEAEVFPPPDDELEGDEPQLCSSVDNQNINLKLKYCRLLMMNSSTRKMKNHSFVVLMVHRSNSTMDHLSRFPQAVS